MRNKVIGLVVGAAITVGLLAWVLRDVVFAEVWQSALAAHWGYLLAAVVVATFGFVLRIPRWQILLRGEEDRILPARSLWHSIAIGFMANNLIPFRAGEFLRAAAIHRLERVSVPTALSSLVAERLFDALTVLALLFLGLLTAGIPADAEIGGFAIHRIARQLAVAPALLLAACLIALFFPALMQRIIRSVVPSPRLADWLCGFIDGITAGLSVFRSPSRVVVTAFWSILHWLNNAFSFYLGFKAFGIEVGLGGAILMQSVLVVLIAVPSTPGYFGVFEAAIKSVLVVLGVSATTAVAYAVTYHFTTFVPITLLGLWSAARTPTRLGTAPIGTGPTPSAPQNRDHAS
ncbi:MAG: flippase-like domain-containing protein [Gemmatimonadales bacterium]|nr:flippase-like domain-containing protein [Gemmatimonadales bacterium]